MDVAASHTGLLFCWLACCFLLMCYNWAVDSKAMKSLYICKGACIFVELADWCWERSLCTTWVRKKGKGFSRLVGALMCVCARSDCFERRLWDGLGTSRVQFLFFIFFYCHRIRMQCPIWCVREYYWVVNRACDACWCTLRLSSLRCGSGLIEGLLLLLHRAAVLEARFCPPYFHSRAPGPC